MDRFKKRRRNVMGQTMIIENNSCMSQSVCQPLSIPVNESNTDSSRV